LSVEFSTVYAEDSVVRILDWTEKYGFNVAFREIQLLCLEVEENTGLKPQI